MRHDGDNTLTFQENCDGLRALPHNSMECGAVNTVWPAQVADGLITLNIIDQPLDIDLHRWTPVRGGIMGWHQYTTSSNSMTPESNKSVSARRRPCASASMPDHDHERPLAMDLTASGRGRRDTLAVHPTPGPRCPPVRGGGGSVQAPPGDDLGTAMRMKRPAARPMGIAPGPTAWRPRKAGSAAPGDVRWLPAPRPTIPAGTARNGDEGPTVRIDDVASGKADRTAARAFWHQRCQRCRVGRRFTPYGINRFDGTRYKFSS